MLDEILKELNNYFETEKSVKNEFNIAGGTIVLSNFINGQYVRIKGSILNDGVYKIPLAGLTDETFTGEIVGLAIPKEVVYLETQINAYVVKNPSTAYTSENFGNYSYSKTTGKNGNVSSWQEVFKKELNSYRKI